MYRKKERPDKPYAKEPLLAFLKAILVYYSLKCIDFFIDVFRRQIGEFKNMAVFIKGTLLCFHFVKKK